MTAILNDDPPGISQIAPGTPPGLLRIVHRCLEKNPEQRFQSASDLAFALEALSDTSAGAGSASGGTVPSSSGSTTGSRLKWLAAAVLLCGLALGLGWWYRNHRPREVREVQQRQLTASGSENAVKSGVISSDGKYLAYSDRDGIFIQEIANAETRKLSGTAGLHVTGWYPDGLRLLVRDDKGDLSIYFMVSGEKRKLASHVYEALLSPDGTRIAYIRASEWRQLWTMPATGGAPKLGFELDVGEMISDMAWSPDGRAIADIRLRGKQALLETRSPVEGQPKVLLSDVVFLGTGNAVLWPRGGRILFGNGKGGNIESDLWAVALDSKGEVAEKPVRLTNTVGIHIGQLSASADGERVAVMFERNSWAIFVANLDTTGEKLEKPVRLTHDSWENFPEFWMPDSQTLFYVSLRDKFGIYKRRLSAESEEPFLVGSENYVIWGTSPDGQWYFVAAEISGKVQLLRVPVSGGTPEFILQPEGVAAVYCGTGNSRACILGEVIGSQIVFTEVDPLRGRLGEIARIDVRPKTYVDWSLSPDGSRIALVENLTNDVRVLDLRSKEVGVIHPMPPVNGIQRISWSPDGKRLFLSGVGEGGHSYLLTMDSVGRTRVLLEVNDWLANPRPSPDGKRLAYLQGVSESNVTLLEHF
jgi:eukaryotic-like serine/threonine-protein kinase